VQQSHKKYTVVILIAIITLLACNNRSQKIPNSNCLDKYLECDSIYYLDSTYTNLHGNLLYARWQSRKGNFSKAVDILDSLEILLSSNKNDKLYQECITHKFIAKGEEYKLDYKEIENQIQLDLNQVHNINMLYLKAKYLRLNQEINFSLATSLFAEFQRSNLSSAKQKEIYYHPWVVHNINLALEKSNTKVRKYFLEKTLNYCTYQTPSCRWMKTLLLTLTEDINIEETTKIKKEVLDSAQFSPTTDKVINLHLNYVSTDDEQAIINLLNDINYDIPLSDESNFHTITYLIDAFLATENIIEAEKWFNNLTENKMHSIMYFNLALYRKQKLLYTQYLKTKNKEKLLELHNCSIELITSYTKQGKSIINEHYADALFNSNNILLETLIELNRDQVPIDQLLNHLNNIKSLYNKISDSNSILGNKTPTSLDLKKINKLKHEIEIRELSINRYQDTTYTDLSIFEELYFLHQKLYDLKQTLPEIKDFTNSMNEVNLELSSLDKQTQILDFIQTDSSFFLSKITSDNIELTKLNYKRTLKAIKEKKKNLQNHTEDIKQNYLDSILTRLVSNTHSNIVFVPDGKLFDFPIESIIDDSGKYLLDSYIISYASQISEAMNQSPTELSDQIFTASYTSHATLKDRSERKYPELGYGQVEVKQIDSSYVNSKSYVGYQFNEKSLQDALDKDIVHFSSHSKSSTDNPLDNYILVRDENGNGIPIYGFTLKSMDWKTKLVILSSCESGTGTIKPGAGIFSLSRDFIQKGAETVIKSLWKVDDRSTAKLMIQFHHYLRTGMPSAKALQQAKLIVKAQSEFSHPYYWSGFILEGNPELSLGLK